MSRGQPPRAPREWLVSPGVFGEGASDVLEWRRSPDESDYRMLGAYSAARIQNDVCNRVRLALSAQERTNAWLARRIGVSEALLSRVRRGETHVALWQVEGFYAVLPQARPGGGSVPKPD